MRRKFTLLYPFLFSVLFISLIFHVKSGVERHRAIKSLKGSIRQKPSSPLPKGSWPNPQKFRETVKKCSSYVDYASVPHFKETDKDATLTLPFQRPPKNCRTFQSPLVELFLPEFTKRLKNRDLARLFENTFPNTIDTTILWHVTGEANRKLNNHKLKPLLYRNEVPETFVVTGDIHAEWLRDSAWQLSVYQPFIQHDVALRELVRGAINTQAQLLMENPFCNAFNPPPYCEVERASSTIDKVRPLPDWKRAFECKYEIDSLASFLTLSRQFYENAPHDDRFSFINIDWLIAVKRVIDVIILESTPTYGEDGAPNPFPYVFQRDTNVASETLPLAGTGNPVNGGTGLVRSAFRPSDDSTIFQFFIPGNAYLAVELEGISRILQSYLKHLPGGTPNPINVKDILETATELSVRIRQGIMEHGIVTHPKFGKVFAYEVDGFGSSLLMDDANIPSLLSLPELGFIDASDPVYENTRKMIMCKEGNPYFIQGSHLQGIGGPHIGIHNVWPLSMIVAIRTSHDDQEITELLSAILESTGGLGLIHESIQAFSPHGRAYTRPWFAWANSEFAKAIIHLAQTKPHLVFDKSYVNERFDLQRFLSSLK
ncbi:LADA_0H18822g1_1 [Lachancea dasiensis]|uniref:LADA_0H18822g1_1 n=1 Tax=Lachancea dasiensis TaxID=1072105 RepID=A0A1G4K611_9SACH|nr:LADA_0H18822g1_1 [Lachancea dasiensis]